MKLEERIRQAAEKYLLAKFPCYATDRSTIHIDIEVYESGAKMMLAEVQPLLCECCKKKVSNEDEKDPG